MLNNQSTSAALRVCAVRMVIAEFLLDQRLAGHLVAPERK